MIRNMWGKRDVRISKLDHKINSQKKSLFLRISTILKKQDDFFIFKNIFSKSHIYKTSYIKILH